MSENFSIHLSLDGKRHVVYSRYTGKVVAVRGSMESALEAVAQMERAESSFKHISGATKTLRKEYGK